MITKETAARIWECYREIAAGEKLLEEMAEAANKECHDGDHARTLRDAFGRRRNLQLGVPSGHSSHQLFDVSPDLAEAVIRAHIANSKARLVEANERARMELSTAPS